MRIISEYRISKHQAAHMRGKREMEVIVRSGMIKSMLGQVTDRLQIARFDSHPRLTDEKILSEKVPYDNPEEYHETFRAELNVLLPEQWKQIKTMLSGMTDSHHNSQVIRDIIGIVEAEIPSQSSSDIASPTTR